MDMLGDCVARFFGDSNRSLRIATAGAFSEGIVMPKPFASMLAISLVWISTRRDRSSGQTSGPTTSE
jgi:hypothetical protein